MRSRRARRLGVFLGCVGLLTLGLGIATPATAAVPAPLSPATRFYVPPPDPGAGQQIKRLLHQGRLGDAAKIARMVTTPQAVWFTGGTPKEVRKDVTSTIRAARHQRAVPVLVAYNVPGRDCSQYSSGGAGSDEAYRAWADGFAAGLRSAGRVVVVVEPDGLSNLPSDCPDAYPGEDVAALTAGRIADIAYLGHAIQAADPDALVYLDAGHAAWHSVGDIADRLHQAGIADFQGFSLNVSNYQPTPQSVQYGTWIAKCLWYAANTAEGGWRLGHYDYCASQYYPATAGDYSTWHLTDQWYATNVDNAANPPAGPSDLAHFVVDTSRNGQGPWSGPQDWCNPPGRGLGIRPTADTGSALADAYLWVKTPGQSDGQCNRDVAGSTTDPEWGGITDPPAGQWFPAQALQLARLASPPLR
ncbi:glycoside hydrolase family 6 protein [Microlunatus ginsengisoli]|uniref:Glucanase n=1 Tax=Microlunatus ginsengisoli TaxID=363863 RepID=A0ABP7A5B0_9ACTN